MNERYARLRAEIWYECRKWFEGKENIINPDLNSQILEKLVDELCTVEQKIMSNGKVDIESKEDMKRRGVASPNMADALCLTFAHGGAVGIGSYAADNWGGVDTTQYVAPHVV